MPQDQFFMCLLSTVMDDKYRPMLAKDFEVSEEQMTWLLLQELHAVSPSKLPDSMVETIRLYVEEGIPAGHFTQAMLAGDMEAAVCRADLTHRRAMPAIAEYLRGVVPPEARGNWDRVRAWRGKAATN